MADIFKRLGARGTTYRARVRVAGLPPLTRTFERKTDARDWAQKTEADLKRNRAFPQRQHERKTLGELIDRYRQEGMPASCAGTYGPHLDWWAAKLGAYRLGDIRPETIAGLREQLSREPGGTGKKRGPTTVNRYLNTLSAVFSFAESEEVGWTDHNPVRKVRRKPEPEGRKRFLSRPADGPDSELDRLLEACKRSLNRNLYDLVVLAILTGMRESEILGLRRCYVHLSEGGITLPPEITKTKEGRFVALVGQALAVVTRRMASEADFLFADTVRRNAPAGAPCFPRKAWLTALRLAGIEDFRFHDLRHTHGSYLAMTGATTRELMEALGHKTPAMAARYSHLANAHTRQVAERMLPMAGSLSE
jgi:integrase